MHYFFPLSISKLKMNKMRRDILFSSKYQITSLNLIYIIAAFSSRAAASVSLVKKENVFFSDITDFGNMLIGGSRKRNGHFTGS